MTDSAFVVRQTHTTDPDGNDVVTETNRGPYPVRLEASIRLPMERPQGGELVAISVWRAHLPHGTDVGPADRLLVNGASYEVTEQTDARTDAVDALAIVKRVR